MTNAGLGVWLARYRFTVLKFAGVGVIATLVHAAVYVLFVSAFNTHAQLANFMGYAVALTVSWFGQRSWTFAHVRQVGRVSAKLRFLITSLTGYGLNVTWVWCASEGPGLHEYHALLGILLLTPIFVFLLLKWWVFVERSDQGS